MKIWHAPYRLRSAWHPADHAGTLLRVEYSGGKYGHADLHPWPELGDADLSTLLKALLNEQPLPFLSRVLQLAAEDAAARERGLSLLSGYQIPRSHKLLTSLTSTTPEQIESYAHQGYTAVKVKLGQDLVTETAKLKELMGLADLRWRFDMNGRLQALNFFNWLKTHKEWLGPYVDGIEDPVARDEIPALNQVWSSEAWTQGFALFSDRIPLDSLAHGQVIKPEIQELSSQHGRRWITNNLGHPFGHAVALAYAARWGQDEVGGLQGLESYELTKWREQIRYHGPVTLPPAGTGFGYDQLLEHLPWKVLQ